MTLQRASSGSGFLRRPGYLERMLVVGMIIVYSLSVPTEWFGTRQDAAETGGALTQLVFLSVFGVAVLGINGNWPLAWKAMGREPLLAALLGWALLSSLWSDVPVSTFTTTVVLIMAYVVGIYLVLRFSLEEIVMLVSLGLAVALFINFAMVFVFPESGIAGQTIEATAGSWTGVFRSRNNLGRLAAVSALVFAANARMRRSWFVWPGFVALAAIQVVGTRSATSLGALLGTGLLGLCLLGFRGRKTLYGATAVVLASVFTVITMVAATNMSGAAALVGRDATFTGRVPLWEATIRYGVLQRRWFGHGWGAFWGSPNAFEVHLQGTWLAPHAHNAFLDAWIQGGPIAAALLLMLYLRGLFWGARNIRADPTVRGMFPILVICQAVIYSLTESGFIARTSQFLLLVVAATLAASNKGVQRPFVPPPPTTPDRGVVPAASRS